jgi:hypothetical protein
MSKKMKGYVFSDSFSNLSVIVNDREVRKGVSVLGKVESDPSAAFCKTCLSVFYVHYGEKMT